MSKYHRQSIEIYHNVLESCLEPQRISVVGRRTNLSGKQFRETSDKLIELGLFEKIQVDDRNTSYRHTPFMVTKYHTTPLGIQAIEAFEKAIVFIRIESE